MTKNSVFSILSTYGFVAKGENAMFWGQGSLMWGDTITIVAKNNGMFSVTIDHWFYDSDGNPAHDNMRKTHVLSGAQALAWVFSEAPKGFWRCR